MPKALLFNYNVSNKCLSITLFPIRSHCLFLLSLHLMHLILLYLSQVYSSVFLTFFTLIPLYLVNLQLLGAMLKLVDAEVRIVFQLLLHILVAGCFFLPSLLFQKHLCVLGVFLCLAVIHLVDKLPLSFLGFLCVLGHPVWLSSWGSWRGWCQWGIIWDLLLYFCSFHDPPSPHQTSLRSASISRPNITQKERWKKSF